MMLRLMRCRENNNVSPISIAKGYDTSNCLTKCYKQIPIFESHGGDKIKSENFMPHISIFLIFFSSKNMY